MRAAVVPVLLLSLLSAARGNAPRAGDGPGCDGLPSSTAPPATANDNRAPAGVRRGDTLVIALVATPARWYPEAEGGCAIPVLAFAEEGHAPSVPGPLVRVPSGTVVRARVRNDAGQTLWLRGFADRPIPADTAIALAAGESRELSFTATAAGTYAYRATLLPYPVGGITVRPLTDDSQLAGALVVDPPLRSGQAPPDDRVLVLTRWVRQDTTRTPPLLLFYTTAVNGRSWPHTERLSYTEGDSVRWRVINLSATPHPMHLHGFYFRLEARGRTSADSVLARPHLLVTEVVPVGGTMRLSWKAERAGNWLFHCHLLMHMAASQHLDQVGALVAARAAPGTHPMDPVDTWRASRDGAMDSHAGHADHAAGMAGLIVGVHVRPAAGRAARASTAAAPRRMLRLYADARKGADGKPAAYGFVLQSGPRAPAADSVLRPGSPIILRRGEPVQITVFNRLAMPLSVHWHGLELESFFDGVGGWSGAPGSIAPPIAPGDSFVVRMTPPRAGTYMYHVHGEEGHELAMGLHGPLLVLDDPAKRDTAFDKVLLFSDGGARRELGAFVNGTDAPRLTMVAGRAHRLRLIGITGDLPAELVILRGADTVSWRYLARDGAEVTGDREALEPARRIIGPGTIADVELVPPEPGELTMQVSYGTFGDGGRTVPPRILRRWTAPITIVAPQVSARPREPSSPRR